MIIVVLLQQLVISTISQLVFPKSSHDFTSWKWISCSPQKVPSLIHANGTIQYVITEENNLCSDPESTLQLQLPSDETLMYTFLFNRALNSDNLSVYLDGHKYTVTNYVGTNIVKIRHKHFDSCITSIDLCIEGKDSINLVFFFIEKSKSSRINELIINALLPTTPTNQSDYIDCCQNWKTENQEIHNDTLNYFANIDQTSCKISGLIAKKVFYNNQLTPPVDYTSEQNDHSIQKASIHLDLNKYHLKNFLDQFPFFKISEYLIEYWYLGNVELLCQERFTIMTQINDNNFSINNYLLEKSITRANNYSGEDFKLKYNLLTTLNETGVTLTITPEEYLCPPYNISYAKIIFWQDDPNNILKQCELNRSNLITDTCLAYNNECAFNFIYNFTPNVQYQYNLTVDLSYDPRISFEAVNVTAIYQLEQQKFGSLIAMLIIGSLFLSIILFLLYLCRSTSYFLYSWFWYGKKKEKKEVQLTETNK